MARKPIFIKTAAEVAIKSKRTKKRFLRQLSRAIQDAMDTLAVSYTLRERWNRFELFTDARDEAVSTLQRVFGIGSILPVELITSANYDEILREGANFFRTYVTGKRFAVRAKRRGRHPYSSQEIERELGALLFPFAAGVDLTHPEVTVHIEIDDEHAYFYLHRIKGAGGLPVGTQGRGISLISGGFDSAVSSWLMLKRGIALDYVFCNLAGPAYERSVLQVAKVIADDWSYGYRPKIYIVDFQQVLEELRKHTRPAYWQVLLKRLMYRAASHIAYETEADALVTGESIGQVSSQTLKNIRAIERATEWPVLRPLVGFDKKDIINLARNIGTASLSEKVKEYCAISPGHPVTAARIERVDEEEAKINQKVLKHAVKQARELDLRALSVSELVMPYLHIDRIPENAVIIDLQPEAYYQAWHHPQAIHYEVWDLLNRFRELDKDRTYVLYCPKGLQSAQVAERMQQEGYEAYSYRGGTRALRQQTESVAR